MKHLLTLLLILGMSFHAIAQRESKDIDSEKLEKQMEDAFSEFQIMMDTLDFSQMFGEDFNGLFGDSFSEGFNFNNLDSLGDLNLNDLLGEDIFKQFGEGMPAELDMENFSQMMEESMKMLDQIDMSQLQEMFEGMDFDFEQFEQMLPGDDFDDKEEEKRDENGKIIKKKKLKKI